MSSLKSRFTSFLPHVPIQRLSSALLRFRTHRRTLVDERKQLLQDASSELGSTMVQLETSFLGIGESLMALDDCSRQLIGGCEKLIEIASGDDEGERLLRETLAILKGPLSYIDFCVMRQEKLLNLLVQCEDKTRAMLGIRDRMHDAIAPLTFMAVLFKIESAYLPLEHRETFMTVTSEVERLHHLVDETFAQNAKQLELAHTTLAAVRQKLEADFKRQAKHIETKRKHIDEAILTLDQQLAQNNERDVRLHDHGSRLAAEVSRMVMGIQFQDIVKQKCDHIAEALAIPPTSLEDWAHTLTLQARQMHAVNEDLSAGVSSIRESLASIEEYTAVLNRSSISLESIESMTAAMDGMVQLLLDSLSDVYEIISMVAKLTEEGFEAVQPARGLARNLTETITELSVNMQLIALNAQIRSVQSGQGTGLETLAARTAEVSTDINGISEDIAKDLGLLHQSIDEMLVMFSEFREQGSVQLAELDQSKAPAEHRLHSLRDKTIMAVQEIGMQIDSMLQSIGKAHESLDTVPVVVDALRGLGERLEAACPEEAKLGGSREVSAESMVNRYTMASERAVHESYMEELNASKSKDRAPKASAVADDKKSVSQAAPATPPAASPQASSLGDNVEFF